MVSDAHDRAFAFFRGAGQRGVTDTMKTAVETVFVGKERQFNRRFLQLCWRRLVGRAPRRDRREAQARRKHNCILVRAEMLYSTPILLTIVTHLYHIMGELLIVF